MLIYDQPDVKVSISEESGRKAACVKLAGDCSASEFRHHVEEIAEGIEGLDHNRLLIDATELRQINSRFISLLLLLLNTGKEIGLKNPSPFLLDLLGMVGIMERFECFKDFQSFVKKKPEGK